MNKKTIIVSSLIILTGLIIAGTYALFQWNTTSEEETILKVTVQGADIIYDGEEDITGANLIPTRTKEEGIVKEVNLSLGNSTINVCADFNLELTTLPDGLKHASFKYEIYKGETLIGEGNFSGKNEGESLKIATSQQITEDISIYRLYLWIDGNMNNPSSMEGQSFSFRFYVDAVDSVECSPSVITYIPWVVADRNNHGNDGANAPQIFDGMIPIRYSEDTSNEWYNYTDKKWANAIMVTSDTRETYMNASVGTKIKEEDVLAYFVWIPRYSYELFNVEFNEAVYDENDTCTADCPETINIKFESANVLKSEGTTNGEMLTHPAFSFGTEEEGYTELEGLWVAKFEPSGSAGAGSLKVLPGVSSLRNQTIAEQYSTARAFANTAYLTETGMNQVDSHMMKNMEWGAVAYLSHSIYGKNVEITINSNSSYYTGGGTGNSYTTNVDQSTTGTVYGVYDINGNATENVMGNLNNTTGDSDLTMANINGKYIDIYENPSNFLNDFSGSKLGDATGETAGWYNDSRVFVISSGPWFHRGGFYYNTIYAGAFSFSYDTGYTSTVSSFRPLLSAK